MNIICGSDFHGNRDAFRGFVDKLNGGYDVGVLAGDLTSLDNSQDFESSSCYRELQRSRKLILFIMGNDDEYEIAESERFVNINQRVRMYKGVSFIGYQFSSPFVGGPFEKEEELQRLDFTSFNNLQEGPKILVTHNPPHGTLDKLDSGLNVGSRALLEFVERIRPEFHIFGHIHESCGFTNSSINASFPKERCFYGIDYKAKAIRSDYV